MSPAKALPRRLTRKRSVVVVVMVHVMVLATLPLCFFKFGSAFACLFTVFAMPMDRVAQFVFCLVNTPFTSFMPVVVCANQG